MRFQFFGQISSVFDSLHISNADTRRGEMDLEESLNANSRRARNEVNFRKSKTIRDVNKYFFFIRKIKRFLLLISEWTILSNAVLYHFHFNHLRDARGLHTQKPFVAADIG